MKLTSATLLALLACSSCEKSTTRPVVETKAVGKIEALGYVEPASELRNLASRRLGVIAEVCIKEGTHVEAGTVLVRLHSDVATATVAKAEAMLKVALQRQHLTLAGAHQDSIKAAEAKAAAMEAMRQHAQREAERLRTLGQQAVSISMQDAAESTASQAKAVASQAAAEFAALINAVRAEDKALAAAEVEVAQAGVLAAKADLAEHLVLAPSEGTVLEILHREGEAVTASGSPVILFADTSQLLVRAELNENLITQLRDGQAVNLTGPNLRGRSNGFMRTTRLIAIGGKILERCLAERLLRGISQLVPSQY